MDKVLLNIQNVLRQITDKVMKVMPNDEALGIHYKNWGFPGVSRVDLVDEARLIISLIEERGVDDLGNQADRLQEYELSLQYLLEDTVPYLVDAHAATAVTAYLFTLYGLRRVLESVLVRDVYAEANAICISSLKRAKHLELHLNSAENQSDSISAMMDKIRNAHDAADQLPADLDSLSNARKSVENIVQEIQKTMDEIKELSDKAKEYDVKFEQCSVKVDDTLERCETAYAASTSVGLATAFNERCKKLSLSMWFWVAVLAASLAAGYYLGSDQLHTLSKLFTLPDSPASMVMVNLMLAIISVGAPVWLAWLATKQIGQRFRLAEDYAFKASISRAYEGFRREAS